MKISDVSKEKQITQLIQQTEKTAQSDKSSGPAAKPNAGEDTVHLSPEAKELQRIHDLLATTPAVRTEKVESVKKALESGEYRVQDDAVADKILKDSLLEFHKQD